MFPLLADKAAIQCPASVHPPAWGCPDRGEQENVMGTVVGGMSSAVDGGSLKLRGEHVSITPPWLRGAVPLRGEPAFPGVLLAWHVCSC